MTQILSERIAPSQKIIIASLAFSYDIYDLSRKMDRPEERYNRGLLGRFEERIKTEHIRAMYFPIFVNANHWIAAKIDFEASTVSYGVSMSVSTFLTNQ